MKPLLHIYGASGSGTSTLGRYLAEQFQYAFLDSDDYFWLPTDPKFTTKRPTEQRVPLIRQDIAAAKNGAVLSGSLVGILYNVQLMAIAEHPYYGSFGYHVSSFFAPASRCGTPEELKELVRRAHELGLAVIMDLVHAHYVRNLNEGINELDGSDHHYSLRGKAGYQP